MGEWGWKAVSFSGDSSGQQGLQHSDAALGQHCSQAAILKTVWFSSLEKGAPCYPVGQVGYAAMMHKAAPFEKEASGPKCHKC